MNVLVFLSLLPTLAVAEPEAYLVTYGAGQEVWERFGHNAIWIRDEQSGTDHTFSFGYFEIDRPGFYRDYARGIMLYYGARSESFREFQHYHERDRSIRLQRLNLDAAQVRGLQQRLEAAIFPAPKYYQYDYYFNNCSTYLRDILDQAFDGAIAAQLEQQPAAQTFRDHTRRLTAQRFWLHTGIMLGLGPQVDRPRNAWEEAFLPGALHDWLNGLEIDGELVVQARDIVYETSRFFPPASPPALWPYYLALGVVTGLLILLGARGRATGWRLLPLRLWLLINAISGVLLLYLWFGTAHEAAWRNLALLLLNPLWLGFMFAENKPRTVLWWTLLTATLTGAVVMAWPGGAQFRLDQLAWLVPANLAALLVLRRLRKLNR